jgi:hypothetical protein
MFSILGLNAQSIVLNCSKKSEEDSYKNTIEFISQNNILKKKLYQTKISFSSINIYNKEDELISYSPCDNWGSYCFVEKATKNRWIPSTLINIISLFPDDYQAEVTVEEEKIKFIVKDKIKKMFDDKNIVTEFLI